MRRMKETKTQSSMMDMKNARRILRCHHGITTTYLSSRSTNTLKSQVSKHFNLLLELFFFRHGMILVSRGRRKGR